MQILTDLDAHAHPITLLPSNLGVGVKLDRVLPTSEVRRLMRALQANSQFRAVAGSFRVAEGGHLICEVRQWTLQGKKPCHVWQWMQSLSVRTLGVEEKKRWDALVDDLLALSR